MSRTDKDRRSEFRSDDPADQLWYIEHRHWWGACDYHPRNNIFEFRSRFVPGGRVTFACEGALRVGRHESYPGSRDDRRRIERRLRHACRQQLRASTVDKIELSEMLGLPHPRYLTAVRGR